MTIAIDLKPLILIKITDWSRVSIYWVDSIWMWSRVRQDSRLGLDFSYFSVQISRLGLVLVSKNHFTEFSVSSRSRKKAFWKFSSRLDSRGILLYFRDFFPLQWVRIMKRIHAGHENFSEFWPFLWVFKYYIGPHLCSHSGKRFRLFCFHFCFSYGYGNQQGPFIIAH